MGWFFFEKNIQENIVVFRNVCEMFLPLIACLQLGYTRTSQVVEGTSVITGPKCNKGPICNNILNPSVIKVPSVITF